MRGGFLERRTLKVWDGVDSQLDMVLVRRNRLEIFACIVNLPPHLDIFDLLDEILLLILTGGGKLTQTVCVNVLDALPDGIVGGTRERNRWWRRMSAHVDAGQAATIEEVVVLSSCCRCRSDDVMWREGGECGERFAGTTAPLSHRPVSFSGYQQHVRLQLPLVTRIFSYPSIIS